jgi:hypothetical protein
MSMRGAVREGGATGQINVESAGKFVGSGGHCSQVLGAVGTCSLQLPLLGDQRAGLQAGVDHIRAVVDAARVDVGDRCRRGATGRTGAGTGAGSISAASPTARNQRRIKRRCRYQSEYLFHHPLALLLYGSTSGACV